MSNLTTVPVSICFIIDEITTEGFSLWQQKRVDSNQQLDNKWEAPGGKWNVQESPEFACLREVKEETGVELEKVIFFKDYNWENGDKLINLHTFLAMNKMKDVKGRWFKISFDEPLKELDGIIPPINREIITEMADYLKLNKSNVEYLWRG